MTFIETPLTGAYVIEVEPAVDPRGSFARTFCQKEFRKIGFRKPVVQINHSVTTGKGAVRGMHYQCPPACEVKIIRCVYGRAFDVMVDLRAGSPSFLQWHGVELSRKNMRMVFIPEGFAHGFQALTERVELIYHHSAFYSLKYERGLRFDDPAFAVHWPLPVGKLSVKDKAYPLLGTQFKGIKV